MKLVTILRDENHVGVIIDSGASVLDLTEAAPDYAPFRSMQALIDGQEPALEKVRELVSEHPAAAVTPRHQTPLAAALPDPVRLRDGTLFIAHLEPAFKALARTQAQSAEDPEAEYGHLMASGRFDIPQVLRDQPVYYNADHLSISGPDDEIVAPPFSTHLDYELEFAVVLGKTGRDITEAHAAEYIFGYTIYNDWSLRDTQALVMQASLGPGEGKDFDGGTTLGPCIVTRDELTDPYSLEMTARVNGEEWSRGNSSTMEHSWEKTIALLSRGKTLRAGEVIGSGTVLSGSGFEIGRRLKDGDVVELEVEGIGVLRNRVKYSAG